MLNNRSSCQHCLDSGNICAFPKDRPSKIPTVFRCPYCQVADRRGLSQQIALWETKHAVTFNTDFASTKIPTPKKPQENPQPDRKKAAANDKDDDCPF